MSELEITEYEADFQAMKSRLERIAKVLVDENILLHEIPPLIFDIILEEV